MRKEFISVFINDKPERVKSADYIKAKTNDLQEYGYSTLTEKEVGESLDRILEGKPLQGVIDHFVKGDINTGN